jgi:hypothetical protein
MPHLRKLLLLIAALSSVFVLAACGGDDSSEDEDQITDAIETAATSGEASACTELQTQRFNEQTQFETGDAALTTCEEQAADVAAESVEVSNVEVDGDTATADAAFSGAALGGQTITISLVKEGDQWKLDHLDEFVDFDAEAFAEGIATGASEGPDAAPPEVVDCLRNAITTGDAEAIQAAYLSGDGSQLEGIFGQCLGG